MRNSGRGLGLLVGCVVSGAIACYDAHVNAQIVPDATLGAESSRVTSPDRINFLIDGGATRGTNLFHSFSQFSVPTNGSASFNNAANIQNIFSRVTGGSVSNIDGAIAANGTANLFLLNPNGIIFGPNARLNVSGSFVATTANAIQFEGPGSFSASVPNVPPPLLTVNPSAFLFNQIVSQPLNSIENRGLLSVPAGQSLFLVGGNVSPSTNSTGGILLDGGTLSAPGGRVELGGVTEAATVGFDPNKLSLTFPDSVARADVSLTNGSEVNVRAGGGGSIAIHSQNLNVLSGSKVRAGIASGMGSVNSKAGDIDINVTGAITVADENSLIANAVLPSGMGKGGDVTVTTGSLFVNNGGQVNALTQGQGDAGSVNINARERISLDGQSSGAFSTVASGAVGQSGNIEITAGSLSLTNGAEVSTSTFGQGKAGNIFIDVNGLVLLSDATVVSKKDLFYSDNQKVNAGNITVYANSFSANNSQISSENRFGSGNAGSIFIQANGSVFLSNSDILSDVPSFTEGNAGNITIKSGSTSLSHGSLDAHSQSDSSKGRGNAGNVLLQANGEISMEDYSIRTNVSFGSAGNSGNIKIEANNLFLTNNSALNSTTDTQGNAGNIFVEVANAVSLGNSSIDSGNLQSIAGSAGSITIKAGSLALADSSEINSSTYGQEDASGSVYAGNLSIQTDGPVSLSGRSGIFSKMINGGPGNGGRIDLKVDSLLLNDGSEVSVSTSGKGNAGNISIQADDFVFLTNGSDISSAVEANAVGRGGDISIQTRKLILTDGGQITAAILGEDKFGEPGGQGQGGDIRINASDFVYILGFSPKRAFDDFSVSPSGASSGLSTSTQSGAIGQAGNIVVTTGEFFLKDGAVVNAQTLNSSNGGNITINANTFKADSGGQVISTTGSSGKAGTIDINATDSVFLSGSDLNFSNRLNQYGTGVVENVGPASGLYANTVSLGRGGSIEITTGSFNLTNGAIVGASTSGRGNAGNITISARNAVSLDGVGGNGVSSQVSSGVESGAVGEGGDIKFVANSLTITNGARVSVTALGQGNAGNIAVNARTLFLDRGTLDAITASSDGGSIALQVGDLLRLRHGSHISTTAGIAQASGNGGNITIDAPLIVAVPEEDSDISANAFTGRGGNVQISTQGIFGIQFRPQDTPLSDITASSQFGVNGTVQINTPGVDPSRGLTDLATAPVDISRQIAQNCRARGKRQASRFIITGRGGLPPRPGDPFSSPYPTGTVRAIPTSNSSNEAQTTSVSETNTSPNPDRPPTTPTIVEAQGWVYGSHGEVILTAAAPTLIPDNAGLKPATCPQ